MRLSLSRSRVELEKTVVLVLLQEIILHLLQSIPELQLPFVLDPFAFSEVQELTDIYGPTVCHIAFELLSTKCTGSSGDY